MTAGPPVTGIPSRAWDLVRRAELEARAALEAHDPGAWELLAAATARRRMVERR